MKFIEKDLYSIEFNPFKKIGQEWFLITSGDENAYNTMTASWGGMGVIWRKNVMNVVVRHSRETFKFMENNDLFTVAFFNSAQKDALSYCGSHSGRDVDKAKQTGLTPMYIDDTTAFEQAEMIFVCKKLYADDLDMNAFVEKSMANKFYEGESIHKSYVGEILKVYVKEN